MHTFFQLKGELTLTVFLHVALFNLMYLYNSCFYPSIDPLSIVLAGCFFPLRPSVLDLGRNCVSRQVDEIFSGSPVRWDTGTPHYNRS